MDEQKFTFRRLKSTDAFLMFNIIGKIGVNQFTDCFKSSEVQRIISNASNGTVNLEGIVGASVALEVANVLCCNLPKAENEIYELLATVADMSTAEIRELDMVTFTEMIIAFVRKDEFPDFVKVVSKLFKREK